MITDGVLFVQLRCVAGCTIDKRAGRAVLGWDACWGQHEPPACRAPCGPPSRAPLSPCSAQRPWPCCRHAPARRLPLRLRHFQSQPRLRRHHPLLFPLQRQHSHPHQPRPRRHLPRRLIRPLLPHAPHPHRHPDPRRHRPPGKRQQLTCPPSSPGSQTRRTTTMQRLRERLPIRGSRTLRCRKGSCGTSLLPESSGASRPVRHPPIVRSPPRSLALTPMLHSPRRGPAYDHAARNQPAPKR